MLASGLLVVHDTGRGGKDNLAESTRWQNLRNETLNLAERDRVTWADDTSLVDTSVELNDNLAAAVVINNLELANVT